MLNGRQRQIETKLVDVEANFRKLKNKTKKYLTVDSSRFGDFPENWGDTSKSADGSLYYTFENLSLN